MALLVAVTVGVAVRGGGSAARVVAGGSEVRVIFTVMAVFLAVSSVGFSTAVTLVRLPRAMWIP